LSFKETYNCHGICPGGIDVRPDQLSLAGAKREKLTLCCEGATPADGGKPQGHFRRPQRGGVAPDPALRVGGVETSLFPRKDLTFTLRNGVENTLWPDKTSLSGVQTPPLPVQRSLCRSQTNRRNATGKSDIHKMVYAKWLRKNALR
jgi:hypothetical protein